MPADNAWFSVNAVAAYIAVGGSLLTSAIVIVFTDWRKRRTDSFTALQTQARSASDREIEARAEYVELLQKRVSELEGELDKARRMASDLMNTFRQDYNSLERRYRHLVAGLVTYSSICKLKLDGLGEKIPPFDGWNRFIEEGGEPRPEWRTIDEGGI